jgi:O-Antigen ligase
MPGLVATRRLLVESPAFGCYLLAVALLPFRWLSPLEGFYSNSQWTDVLVAVAAGLWLLERIRDHDIARAFRLWQVPLGVYLVLACASMAVAEPGFGGSWKTVLLMTELGVLAVITADFAGKPVRRRLIAWVIVASALATVALGAIALVLFYADVPNGLVGSYGEQLVPSDLYTRVRAGFDSPPLLASFCIFASGVAASRDAGLSTRLRVPTQVSLGVLCLVTLSRAFIGFLFAVVIRLSAELRGRPRILVPVVGAVVCVGILAALSVGRLHLNPVEPSTIEYVVPDPGNRREAFTTSLETLGDHPLLGVGPGAFPGLNNGLPFRAHLTPLNVAATLGLPALLALSAMVWLLWRSRQRPTDIALWSALAGIALDGLVGDVDHYRHLWILIGLLGWSRPETQVKARKEA